MIAAKRGTILNIIANHAWTGPPGVVHSASAKAGVLAMTQTLAVEWARHKIRVNAIAPGPVHSEGASKRLFPNEMIEEGIRKTIPLRRFANLEEVANAASYRLSRLRLLRHRRSVGHRRRPMAQRRGLLDEGAANGAEVMRRPLARQDTYSRLALATDVVTSIACVKCVTISRASRLRDA